MLKTHIPSHCTEQPTTGMRPAWKQLAAIGVLASQALFAGHLQAAEDARSLPSLQPFADPYHDLVADAGYVEKTAQINDVTFSYVEGPDNGPPLVLLHAQLMDWFSYSRVMPELAEHFHVFNIDYPGHGETTTPATYPMNANRIGTDLAAFIDSKIGEPVHVTGNSSGGLLATWLAAYRPDLVTSALLEDPPLFSSEYPRITETIAYRAFRTSHTAVTVDHPSDFLLYWIDANGDFFRNNIGPGTPFLLTQAVKMRRLTHPNQPVEVGILRDDTIRLLVRGLDMYDPRFGAAFYDGSWNAGFDHATALAQISAPTLLMHANTTIMEDGTLNGAMSQDEADLAVSLLQNGSYVQVAADHVVHLDDPQEFLRIALAFFLPTQQ
ncbi:alpha/beta fold hydrolase [Halopseudomonas pachastrellae]|uniref:alpha/beta fold hydrolase n=1 Tax=Halopseudomonas pachastrellae TaxID=254161 RepID=UPI003D7C88E4